MKKTLLALVVALSLPAVALAAPIKKGVTEISGDTSMGFTSSSTDAGGSTVDSTAWNLDFAGHYYWRQNLGVGAFVNYSSLDVDGDTASSVAIGPSGKYVLPIDKQLNLFFTAGFGYRSVEFMDETASGWQVGAGAGLSYFPQEWVSVNCLADYTLAKLKDGGEKVDVSDLGLKVGLSLYFK